MSETTELELASETKQEAIIPTPEQPPEEKQELAPEPIQQVNVTPSVSGFASADGFALMQRQANLLASSQLVPKQFQGNIPDCVIALEMAQRLGASPFAVMQQMYVIHGKPSWSSQFIISAINSCGKFSALQYKLEGTGDKKTCIAHATDLATGGNLESPEISMEMAKSEGWLNKSGSKWKTMPDLMLRYRAATFFGRLYCPEILLGMQSQEEAYDIGAQEMKKAKPSMSDEA